MGSIRMLHASQMGLEALCIFMVGKNHPRVLEIGWERQTRASGPKPCFLVSSTMNTSSNHNIEAWMVCGALIIIKDLKEVS